MRLVLEQCSVCSLRSAALKLVGFNKNAFGSDSTLIPVRTYRWYRRPKRIHHELRPEPPPFLGKGTQLQKQLDIMFNASEETKKSLVEGLDFPLMTRPMRPKLISCSDQVFQPYKPPEDKSKLTASVTSPARLFSPADSVALRRMRKSMGDFEKRKFLEISHEVYTNLIETMNRVPIRVESVMEYCTEHCYPVLMEGLQGTQITWKYLETVEPSRIVRARIGSFVQDDHEFGQITVRKHSRQIVAIYDRFGRLIRGNLSKPKTVLEYVVFERHMRPLQWGSEWRIHSKIVPEKSTAVSTHNLQVDFRTNIVPDSFVPQFSTEPPSRPVDPNKWDEKWLDPGYYELTDEEEEEIKKTKLRWRRRFDMHPTMRA